LGSKPLILSNCYFKEEEKKDFIWEAGESKKNATTARFYLFFHFDFPGKGFNRTWSRGHVIFSSQ
jgi:hypothetical protein